MSNGRSGILRDRNLALLEPLREHAHANPAALSRAVNGLARDEEANEQEEVFFRRVPVGGRLRLFGSAVTVRQKKGEPLLTPEQTVSDPATNYRRWWNSAWNAVELGGQREAGDWTAADAQRLRTLVDYAHKLGYAMRFYTLNGHTPEEGQENGWDPNYNFGSREAVEKRWRAAIKAASTSSLPTR